MGHKGNCGPRKLFYQASRINQCFKRVFNGNIRFTSLRQESILRGHNATETSLSSTIRTREKVIRPRVCYIKTHRTRGLFYLGHKDQSSALDDALSFHWSNSSGQALILCGK